MHEHFRKIFFSNTKPSCRLLQLTNTTSKSDTLSDECNNSSLDSSAQIERSAADISHERTEIECATFFSLDGNVQEGYGVWLKLPKDEICTEMTSTLKPAVSLGLEMAAKIFDIPPNECFIAPVSSVTKAFKSIVTGIIKEPKPFLKHVGINIQHCLTKPGLEEHNAVRYYKCDLYGRRKTDELFQAEYSDVNPDMLPTAGRVPDVFYTMRKSTRTIVMYTLYPVVVVCTSRLVDYIRGFPEFTYV